jgi:hypothetical protein
MPKLIYKPALEVLRTRRGTPSHESKIVQLFLRADPLKEMYPDVSPYVYCFQNPVKYVDPDGREVMDPGDRFKTIRDAAKDFAKLYNDNSIRDKKEYGGGYI